MRIVQAEDTRSIEPLLNTINEGDCLEKMKAIPDESIDMVLCDLPYGTTQNKWDSIINLDILFTEYRRVIKPRGVIALTSSGLFTAKLMLHAADLYKYKLVWIKSRRPTSSTRRSSPFGSTRTSASSTDRSRPTIPRCPKASLTTRGCARTS